MQQGFLPSNCPQQPLEIWAINYQWMSTCAVAFNLIFGLSFLIFLSITLPVSFFFFFLAATEWYFFVCFSFFSELCLTFLGCIPRIEILTFSFISHVQFVGSDNSFHSEKYCFREISFKTQKQLRLFSSAAIPKKYQLPTCLNSNQHLQVMAPDTLWYKMLLKTHELALLFRQTKKNAGGDKRWKSLHPPPWNKSCEKGWGDVSWDPDLAGDEHRDTAVVSLWRSCHLELGCRAMALCHPHLGMLWNEQERSGSTSQAHQLR